MTIGVVPFKSVSIPLQLSTDVVVLNYSMSVINSLFTYRLHITSLRHIVCTLTWNSLAEFEESNSGPISVTTKTIGSR